MKVKKICGIIYKFFFSSAIQWEDLTTRGWVVWVAVVSVVVAVGGEEVGIGVQCSPTPDFPRYKDQGGLWNIVFI